MGICGTGHIPQTGPTWPSLPSQKRPLVEGSSLPPSVWGPGFCEVLCVPDSPACGFHLALVGSLALGSSPCPKRPHPNLRALEAGPLLLILRLLGWEFGFLRMQPFWQVLVCGEEALSNCSVCPQPLLIKGSCHTHPSACPHALRCTWGSARTKVRGHLPDDFGSYTGGLVRTLDQLRENLF